MLALRFAVSAVGIASVAAHGRAQAKPDAIPVRSLTKAVSTDSGLIRSPSAVRVLHDGHVLVLDVVKRRLTMFDSTLKQAIVLVDTASTSLVKFVPGVGLAPFIADSSVYVDGSANVITVVAPDGTFGRVMASPRASDVRRIGQARGFDPKGRAVYPSTRSRSTAQPRPLAVNDKLITVGPDSAPIMRGDFETRTADTVAMLHIGLNKTVSVALPNGQGSMEVQVVNPLPQIDDWTLLPDGTIAIVRSQDYHIDWVSMDGKLTSTPKMPFDWRRIMPEEKAALIEALRKADSTRRANTPPSPPLSGAPPGVDFSKIPFTAVDPSELPDYYPPIRAGQMKADPEGNVWILPATSVLSQGEILAGGSATMNPLVFDIVNRNGTIVERVRLPAGRNLAGLGPGGIVIMTYAAAPGLVYVERARVTR
jgi:hypothetical protein